MFLPSQTVKLTNVATVRLTVNGKRFEIACYKNKVLDYRAGLEKDLSEVLQTSNIHIFTNVAKGQFAASADLQAAFGANATQEEIAIQILQRGKSLQVSEAERTQLYESCLTQVATQIATNCLHPETGKPYTVSQIKHALTSGSSTASVAAATGSGQAGNEDSGAKKGKKSKKKGASNANGDSSTPSTSQLSFTIQPHKPIKQQYLQALKYLQAANILPITRAGMELQWQYDNSYEDAVVQALEQLEIASSRSTTTTTSDSATTAPTAAAASDQSNMSTRVFTVDPSVYRPLQELAHVQVPGSRLEILRQQVFTANMATSTTAAATLARPTPTASGSEKNEPLEEDDDSDHDQNDANPTSENQLPNKSSNEDDNDDDSDDDDDDLLILQQQSKAKKKQMKKNQRRRVLQDFESDDDEEDENDNIATKGRTKSKPQSNANRTKTLSSSKVPLSATGAAGSLEPPATTATATTTDPSVALISCNTCVGAAFATQSEYRAHFRSDWHRFNQKLKLQGAAAISRHEFEQCDSESFFATHLE